MTYITDGTLIAYGGKRHEVPGSVVLDVPLTEEGWHEVREGEEGGPAVTRERMLHVLSDVQALMIRAKFHLDQEEVSV